MIEGLRLLGLTVAMQFGIQALMDACKAEVWPQPVMASALRAVARCFQQL